MPDKSFDGEYIYLVPLNNPSSETVDSALIQKNRFYFNGVIDSAEIKILRTRPILRLVVQELLVVVEPGRLDVQLDSISSCHGTVLNEALQEWKEEKMRYEDETATMRLWEKNADEKSVLMIKQEQETIDKRYSDFNFNFVKNNISNVLGKFIYNMTKHTLTNEQRKDVELYFKNP